MFKSKLINGKTVYEIDDATGTNLLERANKIKENAFPKTSVNKFGVALLTKKGNIYTHALSLAVITV